MITLQKTSPYVNFDQFDIYSKTSKVALNQTYTTMALSDKLVLEEIENKNIIIDPFEKESLGTSSYDLRLGEWYYREQPITVQQIHQPRMRIFNPYNEKDTHRIWGKPVQARPLNETLPELFLGKTHVFNPEEEGIAKDGLIIMIAPGETVLAHTEEFIGGVNKLTTSMQTRSSHGRSFIGVCKCAGWGDVGYINRWTMEITNFSRYYAIPLVVGYRYAQMVFDPTGDILDKGYGESGKYQSGTLLEDIKKNWKPEMMLPQLYKDRDRNRER